MKCARLASEINRQRVVVRLRPRAGPNQTGPPWQVVALFPGIDGFQVARARNLKFTGLSQDMGQL